MADQKISAMPAATVPLTGAELVPLVQGGTNVKSTVALFGDYARAAYFNHGAWQDTTTQTGSITAGTPFTFNTADVLDGVTLVSGSRLTVAEAGDYNIQWSGQFQNVENEIENGWRYQLGGTEKRHNLCPHNCWLELLSVVDRRTVRSDCLVAQRGICHGSSVSS